MFKNSKYQININRQINKYFSNINLYKYNKSIEFENSK